MKKLIFICATFFTFIASAQTIDHSTFTGFKRSLNNTPWGYTIVNDSGKNSTVPNIERFEVRQGDCAADGSWSDCDNDRERSEIAFAADNFAGKEYWYTLNILVPSTYVNIYPAKTDFFQFYQPAGNYPVWMFQNYDGGVYINRQINHKDKFSVKLIDAKTLNGSWHTFMLNVKWSTKTDGFFIVYVDGKKTYSYSGATLEGDKVYFKYGVYRTYLSRYKTKNNVTSVPTQIVFFNHVKRASTVAGLK